MKTKADDTLMQTIDLRQLGDTAEEIHAALQDPEVFEAVFGEPSDNEIAEALQQAVAEIKAGHEMSCEAPTGAAETDDIAYRTPTKQEILHSIKRGYKAALAGDVLSLEEFREQLND